MLLAAPADATGAGSVAPGADRTTCNPAAAHPFTDVPPSHPFCEEISWLVGAGLTSGFSDGTFRSTLPVTRQAMAAMLWRVAGSPDVPLPDPPTFTDVGPSHPFASAIAWLVDEGITNGFADGTFRSTEPLTRQGAAAMLWRLAGSPDATLPDPSPFTDVGPGHPFATAITWLVQDGIANGYADGTFRSATALTRQSIAAMLKRYHATLSGTVVERGTGAPISGVAVTLHDTSGLELASTSTAIDGTWSFTMLRAGRYLVHAEHPDGTHHATWYGGTSQAEAVQLKVPPPTSVVIELVPGVTKIASGARHSCAVQTDGRVLCWGWNLEGQLGDGTTTTRPTPVEVSGISSALGVAVGNDHSCAVLSDGTVRCWGGNQSGELGRSSFTSSSVPGEVLSIDTAVAIGAGDDHTCAVLVDSSAKCWGNGSAGQLGDGTYVSWPVPVTVAGLTGATSIDGGEQHSCALVDDGSISCWGEDSIGALGNGALGDSLVPAPVPGLTNATSVSATRYTTCATRSGAAPQCWGHNDRGQLGNGTIVSSQTPVDVVGLQDDAVAIATGVDHTCAADAAGAAYCWGNDYFKDLGDGVQGPTEPPARKLATITDAVGVGVGDDHSCAILADGSARCWGRRVFGTLGDGKDDYSMVPVDVLDITDARSVHAGPLSTCAVLTTGTARCWGDNGGKLGNGIGKDSAVPVDVIGLNGIVDMAVSRDHACALLDNQTVWCWGAGSRLGNGLTTQSLAPVQVTGISTAVGIAGGDDHTCAALEDGTARCWGDNNRGQLGDNTITDRPSPVQPIGLSDVRSIDAGGLTTCAVLNDGNARCWGLATPNYLRVPTIVPFVQDVLQTAVGSNEICALDASESVTCWTTAGVAEPTTRSVTGFDGATALTGDSTVCVIQSDATAACWGGNDIGQLGDGTTTNRLFAAPVIGLGPILGIGAGWRHTCAITAAGTARCWGSREYGQLGDGAFLVTASPVRVLRVGDVGG